jgi:hypothetical protein
LLEKKRMSKRSMLSGPLVFQFHCLIKRLTLKSMNLNGKILLISSQYKIHLYC